MRVLVVLHWLSAGGLEIQLLNSVPLLLAQGIQVDVCCTGPEGDLDDDFRQLGCQIFRVRRRFNCLRGAGDLANLLSAHPVTVVHSQFGHASGGIVLGAARHGTPVAVSIHSSMPLSLYRWRNVPILNAIRSVWLRWHRSLMDRHTSIFIGHSFANMDSFAPSWRSEPSRYQVIQNAVAPPEGLLNKQQCRNTLGIATDATVLLHVGTFKPEKNHTGVLEIFRRFMELDAKAILVLVGSGELLSRVRARASALGLLERVVFAGNQKNVWPYYFAADAFIFPSETEGFGNVLVESQQANLPVVASAIPAHLESVAPPQHRFLFPLPDYTRAAAHLADQVKAARADRNPWVGESNEFVRKQFSMERLAGDLVQVYRALDRSSTGLPVHG
jgi:glycosyltransferase involved in cell wall biosynthesis